MTSSFPFLSKKTIFYNMEAFLYLNKGRRTTVQNNSISIHCSLLLHPRRCIPARLLGSRLRSLDLYRPRSPRSQP
jgi:hypothetical protein